MRAPGVFGPVPAVPALPGAGSASVVTREGFTRVRIVPPLAPRDRALARKARGSRGRVAGVATRALRFGATARRERRAPEVHPRARSRARRGCRARDAAGRRAGAAARRRARGPDPRAPRARARSAPSRAVVRRGLGLLRAGRRGGRAAPALSHAVDPSRPPRGARRPAGPHRLLRGQRRGRARGVKLLLVMDVLQSAHLDEAGLWLSDLAVRFAERECRVEIVCTRAPEGGLPPDPLPGVEVHLPGPNEFEATLGGALASHPDVLHIASGGPFGPRVVEILRELPVVLDVHDFWPICPARDLLRRPQLLPCGEHYPFHGCGACAGLPSLRAMDERAQI